MGISNDFRERDYRKRPCPNCNQVGGIKLDILATTFTCTKCGQSNIDPYGQRVLHGRTVPNVPDIPDVPIRDIVEDTYKVPNADGTMTEVVVNRYVVPKTNNNDNSLFDPDSPAAKFAFRLYHKRFKNRRRYLRERTKRFQQTAQE